MGVRQYVDNNLRQWHDNSSEALKVVVNQLIDEAVVFVVIGARAQRLLLVIKVWL